MSEDIQPFSPLSFMEGGVGKGDGEGGRAGKTVMDNLVTLRIPGVGTYMVKGTLIAPLDAPDPWTIKIKNGIATVNPGSVAGFVPTNAFNTFSASGYFNCYVFTDGKTITGAEIRVESGPPRQQQLVPGGLPSEAGFNFGIVSNGKAYRTIGLNTPGVSIGLALTTDKTTDVVPGTPGVDRWYAINFS